MTQPILKEAFYGQVACRNPGSGNIGTDLMYKVQRSALLELQLVAGIDPASEGLALARKLGFETCTDGIEGILRI